MEDWHVFHHQLGVSSLAAGNLTTAQHALDRAWQQRPDALTAKAMAKVLAAQGIGGVKGDGTLHAFQETQKSWIHPASCNSGLKNSVEFYEGANTTATFKKFRCYRVRGLHQKHQIFLRIMGHQKVGYIKFLSPSYPQ